MTALIRNLIDNNRLDNTHFELVTLKKQIQPEKKLTELLVEMNFISREALMVHALEFYGVDSVHLESPEIDASLVECVPYEMAKKYNVFPVSQDENTLYLATSDPLDLYKLDEIRAILGIRIRPLYAPEQAIQRCIELHYKADDILRNTLERLINESHDHHSRGVHQQVFNIEDAKNEKSPIIGLVNLMLSSAVRAGASDIHIEPQSTHVQVRFRVDGCLNAVMNIPSAMRAAFTARIKIITNLDIAECRMTQDGRTAVLLDGRKIDLRVAIAPTHYGEKVVIRLLDPQSAQKSLSAIGFSPEQERQLLDCIMSPEGMVLITGPTGSGKTSTLYAAINHLRRCGSKNIVTIEDPVEYLVDGVNQIQVNPAKDITFATALRSILRQDPNVILVGEIRDNETAEIAFRSAMTGHLVFSTLHTRNAVASITRLWDIGLEPYLISSSLLMVMAQRLVRVVCTHCREVYQPEVRLLNKYVAYLERYNVTGFSRGKGCRHCNFTGYSGRKAIFEMFRLTPRIREMILAKESEENLFLEACAQGMTPLAAAGIEQVALGITTLEEVSRVTDLNDVDSRMVEPLKEVPEITVYPAAKQLTYQIS